MITRLTALIIASRDDILCTSAGPVDGKYIGWITLGPEDRCRPLLNSEPIYNSHEEAKVAMESVVAEIRQKVREENGEHQEASGNQDEPGRH